jgi:hypothetical protein
MSLRHNKNYERLLAAALLLLLVLIPVAVQAQEEPVPKLDIFTGYQWLNPGGIVPAPNRPSTDPLPFQLPDMPAGWGLAFAYNFDRHWALEADVGQNYNKHATETTASFGPRFTWRTEGFNVFAHTLLGLNRLSPQAVDASNGIGAILGGGIDIPVWRPLTLRLFEADYVFAHHVYPDAASVGFPDIRRTNYNGARLRTGLLWNFSYPSGVPPAASCSVQPTEVMVGEPVTANVSGSNFNPKHTLTYTWASTGGKLTSKDAAATIDTAGLAGGSYTVTAHVIDPKMKKGGDVSCSANFSVKELPKNPPTMSCTADPASLQAGATSNISCTCTSPDNVPVNVSGWTSTGGSVSGSGNTATLNTTGASAGPITVSATCTDSRGLTASASTQVTVETPPPPPPQASKLSECEFPNKVKPWRVDNTCKAVLDDVALRLQADPDARLVAVGNAEPTEKRKNLAAERAVNSKAYLTGGEAKQAIDASRIETRTGSAGTKTAEYWVVPAGATFTGEGTQTVDETKVKAVPDHPRAPAKKKAQ